MSPERLRLRLSRHVLALFGMLALPSAAAAEAFFLPDVSNTDRARALGCLAAAVAHEAGLEPEAGREAVAEVVVNRVRAPNRPKTICGVVFEGADRRTGCQFTFTCDGALQRRLPDWMITAAFTTAARVLDGLVPARVSGATHYHADYVSPYWAPSLVKISRIGAHIFYRTPGATDVAARPVIPRNEPLMPGLGQFASAEGLPLPASSPPSVRPDRQPALLAPWGLATGSN